jgi:hypothetical protein
VCANMGPGMGARGLSPYLSSAGRGRRKLSNFRQLLLKPTSYSAFLVVNVLGVIVTGEKNKISEDKGVSDGFNRNMFRA